MTDTHTLEQILHREKMKEPLPDYGFEKSGEEFREETNSIIDNNRYEEGDKKVKNCT